MRLFYETIKCPDGVRSVSVDNNTIKRKVLCTLHFDEYNEEHEVDLIYGPSYEDDDFVVGKCDERYIRINKCVN